MTPLGYNDSIFINCPFDAQYFPILRAMLFAIYRCGFYPKCTLGKDNGLYSRLDKIESCIEECRFGIHDISRIELDNNLPRFNMPFELGIFFGARRFGNKMQRSKNALIFGVDRYRHLAYISDLNGVDVKAHNNDPFVAICQLRDWLKTASERHTIPGPAVLVEDYRLFLQVLPSIAKKAGLDTTDILFEDYCQLVEDAIK